MNRNKVDSENLTERSVQDSPGCTTIDFPAKEYLLSVQALPFGVSVTHSKPNTVVAHTLTHIYWPTNEVRHRSQFMNEETKVNRATDPMSPLFIRWELSSASRGFIFSPVPMLPLHLGISRALWGCTALSNFLMRFMYQISKASNWFMKARWLSSMPGSRLDSFQQPRTSSRYAYGHKRKSGSVRATSAE